MEYLIYSVDCDRQTNLLLKKFLTAQGYEVVVFDSGEGLLKALKNSEKPDMILLDLDLPGISGKDLLKTLRENEEYDDTDIIIVTENNLVREKVELLNLGADDYIEKPFSILEFIARINTKVRRHKKSRVICIDELCIDLDKHICSREDDLISLTTKEFEILSLLFASRGHVLSREEILNKIWGPDTISETRTVDMHIKSLRQKINDKDNKLIITVHGVGYKINF